MDFQAHKSTLLSTAALTLAASLAFGQPANAAQSDILFILDGSGSMWGQIDGVAKIQTAKDTMARLLDETPANARIGVMTYGTRDKNSCTDVSVLNAIGTDRGAIKTAVADLKPLGKTPIDLSLTMGIANLSKTEPTDVQKSLVLISDGIETCDGNPCDVAATARSVGVAMKVHVVGFDVDAETRTQLECIAEKGGGQYFDASDTNGFKQAMDAVVEVAQATAPAPEPEPEAAPEPSGPKITEFYREDFDGDAVSEDWAVTNANPDNFLVEDGVLTILSTSKHGFVADDPENLFTFTGELPSGDWDATISFTGEYSTMADRVIFGLRKDKGNFMTSVFWSAGPGACQGVLTSLAKGQNGKYDSELFGVRGTLDVTFCNGANITVPREAWDTILPELQANQVHLTLSKRGRSYQTSVRIDNYKDAEGNPVVITTDRLSSLRSPGDLSFAIDRYHRSGETLFLIDSIVINKVE